MDSKYNTFVNHRSDSEESIKLTYNKDELKLNSKVSRIWHSEYIIKILLTRATPKVKDSTLP